MGENQSKMDISSYYNDLARRYDADRFSNSYGQFLHRRETKILERLLPKNANRTLDLACGTGRFSHFATDGLDQSAEMIAVAQEKWPEKAFFIADARRLPFENEAFGAIFSLHLAMHLSENDLLKLLSEAHRCLEKGGVLVIDFPSKKRRNLLRKRADGWHGATAFDEKSFLKLAGEGWRLQRTEGVLMLPVHRFPRFSRPFLLKMDVFLGKRWIRGWSSYLFVGLEKI